MTVDRLPASEAARELFRSQQDALATVEGAINSIVEAAQLIAKSLAAGKRIIYAGAGTSGLMAMADALELPLTYGIDPAKIAILLAGGQPGKSGIMGTHDDDVEAAARDASAIESGDAVIAVSAAGSTPYTVRVLEKAKAKGANTVAIANKNKAELFSCADVAVALPTETEKVEGSTRMGAGTAQKVALNMISTLVGIELGHVHDGMMVNFIPDNDKLRERAVEVVATIAKVERKVAKKQLIETGWQVKLAVLAAKGVAVEDAKGILASCDGRLAKALGDV